MKGRTAYRPSNRRRILLLFPPYAPSFGTFRYGYELIPGVRAFMPPQGLLAIAAYLPKTWEVRFVDENFGAALDADFEWADAVFTSGMHVQRPNIEAIVRRAHRYGKLSVLGGPSVSACPEYYPGVDCLHIGELGDATDALIERIDRDVRRPRRQQRFETSVRVPLEDFPIPAYDLVDLERYFIASIQFSSGCPYLCEFCDIPELYGRQPRLKSGKQITAELDAIVAGGARQAVYFVDDNFIGNRKATRALLPHLIEWQKNRGYPVEFACEATLNIAQWPDILAQMREANFTTVFCGIETPEPDALVAMDKKQNLKMPIADAVKRMNDYGLEVVSGIILGLDTDTPKTLEHLLAFIEETQIPMLTINLLYALPRTPLYRRLEKAGRLVHDPNLASNVRFKMPYADVLSMWHRSLEWAYEPERLLARFAHQAIHTFPNRLKPPRKVTPGLLMMGIGAMLRVLWRVGIRAPYRRAFWRVVTPLIKRGRIDDAMHIAIVTHHLVQFTRDTLAGHGEASFYVDPTESAVAPKPVNPLRLVHVQPARADRRVDEEPRLRSGEW